jgi:hypothetical protein
MRKIRAEMPSKPQQNDLGMESNALIALDVAPMIGPGCSVPAGDRLGRIVMRAVSFFGPVRIKFSDAGGAFGVLGSRLVASSNGVGGAAAGSGRGRKTGTSAACGSNTGGGRNIVSGFWGSAIGTVSFFGSAMTNQVAPRKITENPFIVTP